MGLAGLGDLVLTAPTINRATGARLLLAAGRTAQAALAESARRLKLRPAGAITRSPHGPGGNPLCEMAYRVLYHTCREGRGALVMSRRSGRSR